MSTLADPDTPFAVVDVARSRRNCERLRARIRDLGVALRPHVKTAKSIPLAKMMHGGDIGPITVSTLREAEAFARYGYDDITYAVGLDPHKLPRIARMAQRGVTVRVLLDSVEQAVAVDRFSTRAGVPVPALIEIDSDGHRGGITAEDPALLGIAAELDSAGNFEGVLTHAGESYAANGRHAQEAAARHERDAAVRAARRLERAGIESRTVSVGSTPTAHAATDLSGVSEVRAGNYVFFDLVMAGIGVCALEDLALSVVVTVIGHESGRGWILTDGGWMALSRDRGTAAQHVDQGYGLVTDLSGRLLKDLVVTSTSQEHGVITSRNTTPLPDLPIGTRLRILPNHACATATQFDGYHIVDSARPASRDIEITAFWPRLHGW